MKLREIFGSRVEASSGARKIESSEETSPVVEPKSGSLPTTEQLKWKYAQELIDYEDYTDEELLKLEKEFQEKSAGANSEEIIKLKQEKDRKQALLRENLVKVKQNLEESLLARRKLELDRKTRQEENND